MTDHRQDAFELAEEISYEDSGFYDGYPETFTFDQRGMKEYYKTAYEAGKADANALPELPDKLCWSLSGPFKGEAGPVYRFCHDNFTGGNVNQGCGYGPTLYEAALEAIKQIKGEG